MHCSACSAATWAAPPQVTPLAPTDASPSTASRIVTPPSPTRDVQGAAGEAAARADLLAGADAELPDLRRERRSAAARRARSEAARSSAAGSAAPPGRVTFDRSSAEGEIVRAPATSSSWSTDPLGMSRPRTRSPPAVDVPVVVGTPPEQRPVTRLVADCRDSSSAGGVSSARIAGVRSTLGRRGSGPPGTASGSAARGSGRGAGRMRRSPRLAVAVATCWPASPCPGGEARRRREAAAAEADGQGGQRARAARRRRRARGGPAVGGDRLEGRGRGERPAHRARVAGPGRGGRGCARRPWRSPPRPAPRAPRRARSGSEERPATSTSHLPSSASPRRSNAPTAATLRRSAGLALRPRDAAD